VYGRRHAKGPWRRFAAKARGRELQSNAFDETGQIMTDETLQRYRESIDNIDAAIIYMLAERFKVTQQVGEFKAKSGLPAADSGREQRQIERLRRLATDANLDPEFSEKFLRFIIDEVIRHHQKIKNAS